MSRGLGTEQRWLLDWLDGAPNGLAAHDGAPRKSLLLDALDARYGNASAAQTVSMRRAAHTLAARGLIEVDTGGLYDQDRDQDNPRYNVRRATWLRRTPTDSEAAMETQAQARWLNGTRATRSADITPEAIATLAELYGVSEDDVWSADPRHWREREYFTHGREFFHRLEMLPGERPMCDTEAYEREVEQILGRM
jgi:hypothetical protein